MPAAAAQCLVYLGVAVDQEFVSRNQQSSRRSSSASQVSYVFVYRSRILILYPEFFTLHDAVLGLSGRLLDIHAFYL